MLFQLVHLLSSKAGKWGDSDVPYLQLVVAFIVLVHLWETYLDLRQRKALQLPKPPPALAGVMSQQEYTKTQAYNLDKWQFSQVKSWFGLALEVPLLLGGYLPWLWAAAGRLLQRAHLAGGPHQEIKQTIMFLLLDQAKDLLIGLPLSYYFTFVIEERHGFNKMTRRLFFMDQVKTVLLGLVIAPPIVAGMTWILRAAGPYVALYLWLFLLAVGLFMMTIYPTVIQPLFNKFEPLPEGPLRSAIEALAGSLHFPLRRLYVMDGSTRSAHSNAYMYGFFRNKRIVLFDTLVKDCREEEVVAVLAHELGHWKLGHTLRNFLIANAHTLATMSLFTLVRNSRALFASFGFQGEQPAFVALLLFNFIQAPLDQVVSFLMNVLSRAYEFQADAFAVSLGYADSLRAALLKLDAQNRSASNVDPWYSAAHYSHPPLVERLKAIGLAAKKVQ